MAVAHPGLASGSPVASLLPTAHLWLVSAPPRQDLQEEHEPEHNGSAQDVTRLYPTPSSWCLWQLCPVPRVRAGQDGVWGPKA